MGLKTIFYLFVLIILPQSISNYSQHMYSSSDIRHYTTNNYSDGNSMQIFRSSAFDRSSQAIHCVKIPKNFTLCHEIQYESMRLPNLLDHEDLNEAIVDSEPWNSLIKLDCHPDTKLFLCSLFAPICLPNLDKYILPCQSMCLAVKNSCESRMRHYNFPWPEMLQCKFPEDNDMCIKPVPVKKDFNNERICKSCAQMSTFENIMDNYCRSHTVFKGQVKFRNVTHITVSKIRFFKKLNNIFDTKKKKLLNNKNVIKELTFRLPTKKCLCLKNDTSSDNKKQNYLIMLTDNLKNSRKINLKRKSNEDSSEDFKLNFENNSLKAQLVLNWKKKDKIFKQAIRKFQKINCSTLGQEIRERVLRGKLF